MINVKFILQVIVKCASGSLATGGRPCVLILVFVAGMFTGIPVIPHKC
jgi:hypothetical protein